MLKCFSIRLGADLGETKYRYGSFVAGTRLSWWIWESREVHILFHSRG